MLSPVVSCKQQHKSNISCDEDVDLKWAMLFEKMHDCLKSLPCIQVDSFYIFSEFWNNYIIYRKFFWQLSLAEYYSWTSLWDTPIIQMPPWYGHIALALLCPYYHHWHHLFKVWQTMQLHKLLHQKYNQPSWYYFNELAKCFNKL